MQHHPVYPVNALGILSGPFGDEWRSILAPHENVLAGLEVDLSADLHFQSGQIILTTHRLLARQSDQPGVREWPLISTKAQGEAHAQGLSLQLIDHGGIGTLELHNAHERLSLWRFTLGVHPQALRLVQSFEQQLQQLQRLQSVSGTGQV